MFVRWNTEIYVLEGRHGRVTRGTVNEWHKDNFICIDYNAYIANRNNAAVNFGISI